MSSLGKEGGLWSHRDASHSGDWRVWTQVQNMVILGSQGAHSSVREKEAQTDNFTLTKNVGFV